MSKASLMDVYRSTVGKKSLKESPGGGNSEFDEIVNAVGDSDFFGMGKRLDAIGYKSKYVQTLNGYYMIVSKRGEKDKVVASKDLVQPSSNDVMFGKNYVVGYMGEGRLRDNVDDLKSIFTENMNRLDEVSHNRYTPVKTDFGGFRNIETQKIASSLTENRMESAISTFMRGYKGNQPYRDFIQSRALSGSGTKYGINWIDQRLDYPALNEQMRNLTEAYGLHPDVINQYLETALWSSGDGDLEYIDSEYDINDIDPGSKREAEQDIEKMIDMAEKAGVLDPYLNAFTGDSWGQFGHDFWLTRNGHGAGFWDRSEIDDEVGKKLTDLANSFGEASPYVGDDGKIYIQRG